MMSNIHTHTLFCDGKDTPEDMVTAALEKGFKAIGFSGHAKTSFDLSYCMKDEEGYRAEINRLKEKYKDKIEIYLGIERDLYADEDSKEYDFVIASVHYLKFGEAFRDVDLSGEYMSETIEKYCGGDANGYAKAYFEAVAQAGEKYPEAIIGHFDLLTKFNETSFFIPYTKEYEKAAFAAVDRLKGRIFEINTGAMSRGYRTAPYPDERILKYIEKNGGEIIFTSDCHNKKDIDFGFDMARTLAKQCGFKSQRILLDGEFVKMPL